MAVFRLSEKIEFPPVFLSEPNGLLCVGGDLSCERLIHAYKNGIFPWFSEDEPILWWSPDPRLVLFPENIKISKSLRKKIRKNYFEFTIDKAFEDVIQACSDTRKIDGTWLVDKMIKAYISLHKKGYAHSIEVWKDDKLAGGLYGVSLGGCFFGESMFSLVSDASKFALVVLCSNLKEIGFDLIDCQVSSNHLISMGAEEISRYEFLKMLRQSLKKRNYIGKWNFNSNILV